MIKISVRSNILRHFQALHVVNLGARDLISVFDRTLPVLLIFNRLIDGVLHSLSLTSSLLESVTLVGVLVTLYKSNSVTGLRSLLTY